MTKFDLSGAWDDAVQLLRGDLSLTSALAGAFVLLPALAYALIGPVPFEPAPGADMARIADGLRAELPQLAPILVVFALLSSLTALAVSRLWLAPAGTSVGEALAFAVALLPTLLLLFAIQALATGLAAMAFLLPALYLAGRWAPTVAVLAAGETRSPVGALAAAWNMTRGNGWRIAIMLVLVQIIVVVTTVLIDGLGGLFGARGTIGYAFASLVSAAVAAAAALVGYALNTAIYRQLSQSRLARTFD